MIHSTFSAGTVDRISQLEDHYRGFFRIRPPATGSGQTRSPTRETAHQLTAFFSWSAWTAAALRPGHDYSYTNNWPPEPLVANTVTANTVVWSVLSLIALLGGIGLLFAAFGRWNILGWHGRERQTITFRPPGQVALTPAQRADGLVLLRDGPAVSDPVAGRRRFSALPSGPSKFLRNRPGPHFAV